MGKILVVDDDPQMQFLLGQALKNENYESVIVKSGADALASFGADSYELVLMDVRLPDMNGLDAVREIKKISPRIPVIVMTAYNSRENAIEAIKRGACDYFTKPFKIDELRLVIQRVLEKVRLVEQIDDLKEQLKERKQFGILVGESEKLLQVIGRLGKICRVDSTVFVVGESGKGKELVAQAIHDNSARAGKPFIKINCAAIPGTLLESELFGYKKGSFTGAEKDKKGKFQAADGGTLVLDEIGDMPLELQAKILRALEQREVERVGDTVPEKVDVRIIASTNKDLGKMVEEGQFRQDLYYRLAVFKVEVPPLRERLDDVPRLVRQFIQTYRQWLDKNITGISDDAMTALTAYDWPGNVRELKNCIEVAATMTDSDLIDVSDLPSYVSRRKTSAEYLPVDGVKSLDYTLKRFEKQIILDALHKCDGVQAKAAQMLGITERSIWHRIKKHNIDVDSARNVP